MKLFLCWIKLNFPSKPFCCIRNSPHVSSSIGKKDSSSPTFLNLYSSKFHWKEGCRALFDKLWFWIDEPSMTIFYRLRPPMTYHWVFHTINDTIYDPDLSYCMNHTPFDPSLIFRIVDVPLARNRDYEQSQFHFFSRKNEFGRLNNIWL